MSRGLSSFLLKGKLSRICITKLDKQNSSHFTTPTITFCRPPCPYSYCIYSSVCLLYLYSSNFIFWPTILHVYICVTNERKKLFSEFMNLLFDPYCSLRLLIPVFVCTFSWIQTVSVSFTVSSIPISKSTVFIHSQMYKIDIFFEWCERNLITFLRFYDLIRWNDWWIISLCYVLPRCESERCIIAVRL